MICVRNKSAGWQRFSIFYILRQVLYLAVNTKNMVPVVELNSQKTKGAILCYKTYKQRRNGVFHKESTHVTKKPTNLIIRRKASCK